jgi:hypothetical protein
MSCMGSSGSSVSVIQCTYTLVTTIAHHGAYAIMKFGFVGSLNLIILHN